MRIAKIHYWVDTKIIYANVPKDQKFTQMAKSRKSGNGKNDTQRKFHNSTVTGAPPKTVKINMAYKNGVKKTPFISGKKLIR